MVRTKIGFNSTLGSVKHV